MKRSAAPLLVEVTRGDSVESRHEVDAVAIRTDGTIVGSWGDPVRQVLPRSALKPIQAIPLVATGAANSFALSEVELALACASHDGEPAHVQAVACWLERVGVPVDELACGVHRPMSEAAAIRLAELGRRYTALHNNCSGKHAGLLTLCRHLGLPTDRYFDASHQLQRDHVTPSIEEWCGIDLTGQEPSVDGCGIPAWGVPLERLAAGWASLGMGRPFSPERRLLDAMRSEPFFVAGRNRACTRLIDGSTGGTVVKAGAEGVFCAVVPDDGIGVALKTGDGAGRGSSAALTWILVLLGRLSAAGDTEVVNHEGLPTGVIRVIG